ncbi:MAG: hypothetical protein ICCCNLDF_02260 [Planctomycetes bacterium]|nr:hypothetical protein [Planctomycetota bacterium]
MESHVWVRIGAPLTEADAKFLRDLIHQKGVAARVIKLAHVTDARCWCVLTRPEDMELALDLHDRNFSGPDNPTRRPTRRWGITNLFKRRRPAA